MKRTQCIIFGCGAVLGAAVLTAMPSRLATAQTPPAAAEPAAPAQREAQQPEEPKPLPVVMRFYDIHDLLQLAPDRPLGPGILPPTQLTGAMFNAGRNNSQYGQQRVEVGKTSDQKIEDIVKLIEETVARDSWLDTGGSIGSIREYQGSLIIHQTEEYHRQVTDLLELLRKNCQSCKTVTVHADWLWLNPGELAEVTRPGAGGTPGSEIDPAAVAKLGPKAVYAHARITCSGDQTVHLLSGHAKTMVENVEAQVGTGSAGYTPDVDEVLEGAALQVTPHIEATSARVDILAFASGWGNPGQPYRFVSQSATVVAGGKQGDAAGASGGAGNTIATMDKMNVLAQEFCTTAKLPLGKPTIVGGMTMEPEGSNAGDGKTDARPADSRQLYLVLRVDAE